MGSPAIVEDDRVTGQCVMHMMPGPGGQQPAPPQKFDAPLSQSLVRTVLVHGKAAAVLGSWGMCTPPHVGITDPPYAAAPMQKGTILSGSATVLIGGQPAANADSLCQCCYPTPPGKLVPAYTDVLIGS